MKFVGLSDTHGKHHSVVVPEGDVIIHCGDITQKSNLSEVTDFIKWFSGLHFQYKILVAGNHDRFIGKRKPEFYKLINDNKIEYLENSLVRINGFSVWGSPFTLNHAGIGAFTYNGHSEAELIWSNIPDKIDILVTHAPPRGFKDFSRAENGNAGCLALREKVLSVRPRFHIFGHIHESYGIEQYGGSVFINASLTNCSEEIVNDPVVFEI